MFLNERLLICLFLLMTVCNSYKAHGLLEQTLETLKKTILYYDLKHSEMNLDGIFGLRLIEGQISHIKDRIGKMNPTFLDHPLMFQLENIRKEAAFLSKLSIKYLKNDNAYYFDKVGWVVSNPWNFSSKEFHHIYWRDYGIFEKSDAVVENRNIEYKSDKCIEVITTRKNGCHLPKACLEFIAFNKSAGYELTHQLLNVMLIEMVNCTNVVDSQLRFYLDGISLSYIQNELCIKNFFETSTILAKHDGNIPIYYQDLFFEELMVCPMLGYFQFLHERWLLFAISRQHEKGCWVAPKVFELESLREDLKSIHSGRRLLYEKILSDGCSSHMTAAAVGTITQFLKYLVLCELADVCGIRIPTVNYLLNPSLLPYDPSLEGQEMSFSSQTILVLLICALAAMSLRFFCRRRTLMRVIMKLRYLTSRGF